MTLFDNCKTSTPLVAVRNGIKTNFQFENGDYDFSYSHYSKIGRNDISSAKRLFDAPYRDYSEDSGFSSFNETDFFENDLKHSDDSSGHYDQVISPLYDEVAIPIVYSDITSSKCEEDNEYAIISDTINHGCSNSPPPLPKRTYKRKSLVKRPKSNPHIDDILKDTDIVDMNGFHVYTVRDVLESVQSYVSDLKEITVEPSLENYHLSSHSFDKQQSNLIYCDKSSQRTKNPSEDISENIYESIYEECHPTNSDSFISNFMNRIKLMDATPC